MMAMNARKTMFLVGLCLWTEACGDAEPQQIAAAGGQGGQAAVDGAAGAHDAAVDGQKPSQDAGDSATESGHLAADAGDAQAQVDATADSDSAHTSGMLDTTVVSQIVEPPGSGTDDKGIKYSDQNYWNLCSPGAVTVALYFVKPDNVVAWPSGSFKEPPYAASCKNPANGTYWASEDNASGYHTYGRAYLMHLAMEVAPPTYVQPGMVNFASCPTTGSFLKDDLDALNWEGSGHASNWQDFHYHIQTMSGYSAAKLHGHVKQDIDAGFAIVAAVDTHYLPNWDKSLSHAITIVGYDDVASTYSYTDTCGHQCNGAPNSKNGGVWSISQNGMYQAIYHDDSGYVW